MSRKKRKKKKRKHARAAQNQVTKLDRAITKKQSQGSGLDLKHKQPEESQVLRLDKNTLREVYGAGGKRISITVDEATWQQAKTFTPYKAESGTLLTEGVLSNIPSF